MGILPFLSGDIGKVAENASQDLSKEILLVIFGVSILVGVIAGLCFLIGKPDWGKKILVGMICCYGIILFVGAIVAFFRKLTGN